MSIEKTRLDRRSSTTCILAGICSSASSLTLNTPSQTRQVSGTAHRGPRSDAFEMAARMFSCSTPGLATFARPVHLSPPTKRYGLDGTSLYFKLCLLPKVASHCYPYQSGERKLSRPYTHFDLEAAASEPGSLLRCRFSRFVAFCIFVCICGFADHGSQFGAKKTPLQPHRRRVCLN